jgi:hypothetical protein
MEREQHTQITGLMKVICIQGTHSKLCLTDILNGFYIHYCQANLKVSYNK